MQFFWVILSFPTRHVELPNGDERNGTNTKDSTGLGWTVLTRVVLTTGLLASGGWRSDDLRYPGRAIK